MISTSQTASEPGPTEPVPVAPSPLQAARALPADGMPGATAAAERFLAAVAALDELHALTHLDAEMLRADALAADRTAASGPLHGLLYAVKDIIDVAGMPTSGGSAALAGIPVSQDAPAVARLREAGAIVAAKTNLHEFSFGITSNNAVHGAVGNPYDSTRIAGGSSGGSAVAVAVGLVSFALAADTGGSARIPAALCGIVGFRPTIGRYPMAGVIPISPTRDTIGLFAHTVDDVRTVDVVLGTDAAGPPVGAALAVDLTGLRLGRPGAIREEALDPDVAATYERVLARLEAAGAEIVDLDLAPEFAATNRIGLQIALHEFPGAVQQYLTESGGGLDLGDLAAGIGSPDVQRIWAAALDPGIPAEAYRAALAEREELARSYAATLDAARVECIAFPTTPVTARPIGEDDTIELNGERAGTFDTYTRFTNLAGVLGLPGISLPAGLDSAGLPIGVELDGRAGTDDRLLAVAAAIEPLLPQTPAPPHALS